LKSARRKRSNLQQILSRLLKLKEKNPIFKALLKFYTTKKSYYCVQLKLLDLCSIKIEKAAAEHLQNCIENIDRVRLQLCQLPEEGIKALSIGIRNRHTKVNTPFMASDIISNKSHIHKV